jgi:hypothetical protein
MHYGLSELERVISGPFRHMLTDNGNRRLRYYRWTCGCRAVGPDDGSLQATYCDQHFNLLLGTTRGPEQRRSL